MAELGNDSVAVIDLAAGKLTGLRPGFFEVFALGDQALRPLARIRTGAGARTSLFAPDQDRLYVAVPRRAEQQAAVLISQPTM